MQVEEISQVSSWLERARLDSKLRENVTLLGRVGKAEHVGVKLSVFSVNIDKDASVGGLHEKLEEFSHQRATNVARIAAKIYAHAVNNKPLYKPPLKVPGKNPGKHISARVTDKVRKELAEWAKVQGSTRNKWCCFLLQKALENGNLENIIDGD